jgi:hypothetical protein
MQNNNRILVDSGKSLFGAINSLDLRIYAEQRSQGAGHISGGRSSSIDMHLSSFHSVCNAYIFKAFSRNINKK